MAVSKTFLIIWGNYQLEHPKHNKIAAVALLKIAVSRKMFPVNIWNAYRLVTFYRLIRGLTFLFSLDVFAGFSFPFSWSVLFIFG